MVLKKTRSRIDTDVRLQARLPTLKCFAEVRSRHVSAKNADTLGESLLTRHVADSANDPVRRYSADTLPELPVLISNLIKAPSARSV